MGSCWSFWSAFLGFRRNWSGKGILAAITDRIHLGLDLRGGTHLILQVQVNDAVNVDSDNAIARLKEDMRARKINYADITKPDPVNHPEMIVVKGIPPEQTSDFKSIVSDRLPDYDASLGRGKFLDGFDEGAKPRRFKEPRGRPGDRDHPQSN